MSAKQLAAKAAKDAKKASKKTEAPADGAADNATVEAPDVCKLDLRVGVITKAWEHPESVRV